MVLAFEVEPGQTVRWLRSLARTASPMGRRWIVGFSAAAKALLLATSPVAGAEAVRSLLEMRQERVVVQEWDLSCGAAALATVLNFQLGNPVSEREIARGLMHRKEYIEDSTLVAHRMGFSLLDLKRYVEQLGYRGIGYGRLELDDLIERAPAIVPVNFNGW